MRLLSLFFLLGTIFIQLFADITSVFTVSLLLAGSVIIAFVIKTRASRFYFYAVLLVAFSCGFFWATLSAQKQLESQLLKQYEGIDLIVTGKIVDIPQLREKGTRFRLSVTSTHFANNRAEKINLNGIIRLGWYQNPKIVHAGEQWQLRVRLKRPSGFMNPGGFDYEKWLFSERISATGYIRKSKENENKD